MVKKKNPYVHIKKTRIRDFLTLKLILFVQKTEFSLEN